MTGSGMARSYTVRAPKKGKMLPDLMPLPRHTVGFVWSSVFSGLAKWLDRL
jgi:hypothetical protein